MSDGKDWSRLVNEAAAAEVKEEQFRELVELKKKQLRWPWWRRACPFKLKIQVIDLRKE